jgi:hypothetical protein
MYNVQNYCILHIDWCLTPTLAVFQLYRGYNAVRHVICEGWHLIHMWKTLARPHHFTKMGGLGP